MRVATKVSFLYFTLVIFDCPVTYLGPQLSRQNLVTYSKINFATAKSIPPRQNKLHYGQINFIHHDKIIFSRSKICFTQYKINFTHRKIHFTTAKSSWLTCSRAKCFNNQLVIRSLIPDCTFKGAQSWLNSLKRLA